MKRFHGLARAKGYGLLAVSKQTKLTVIAVNLKKIAKLSSSNNTFIMLITFEKFLKIQNLILNSKFSATFSVLPDVPVCKQWTPPCA